MLPSNTNPHLHESARSPRTRRPFRAFGALFIAVALVILALGLWTYSFESVSGRLLDHHHGRSVIAGDYPGIPLVARGQRSVPTLFVNYRYTVDGRRYESSRVGMGFRSWSLSPFSLMDWERDLESLPANVEVWHSPAIPEISVLHRGPDVVLTISFAFMGLTFLSLSNWIGRHSRV
ncbi:DUF3592 domain-containing protein [Wenzhouxiangella sp. XN79A]|uniref:DUF3592 domain-containing protein n=1 Tax=Wenzhouxiangella sp. XN79A TaxID=2724193 RepID=UPI00144AF4BE|nr:DUF3592 domain-containing protein [Wenzhouxiangella sp. XN79A]NKI35596.1 DUF3592 domain-containing protein [Wenzhouxiangella sp. XN79A]